MIRTFGSLLTACLLVMLIGSSSCSDKCKKLNCKNGGACYDGICDCKTGFEGDSCTVETREKFLGTYTVMDHCTLGDTTYTVNVSASDNELLEVNIANFNNDFANYVVATVDGAGIEIAPQAPDQDGRSVTGSGVFSGGSTITWDYTITDTGNPTNKCTNSLWTK